MDKDTILIVHEDASVRDELKSHLAGWDYQVLTAEDDAQARDLFRSANPSLVLLAVTGSGSKGQDLMAEFKAQNPEVPIIIMANSGSIDEAIRCLSMGAYDVVVVERPIRFERLQHVIKHALELYHLKSKLQSAGQTASSPGTGPLAALAHGIPSTGIALFDVEKQLIEQALQATGWNKSKAARLLHITRDTLRYKVKKYHLEDHPPMPVGLAS